MRLIEHVRHQEFISKLLHRFVSPQEAQTLLKEYLSSGTLPPVAEQSVTILTADICQSTQLAERVGARRFGSILSLYYSVMSQVIFDHNGLMGKYIGDGLMAIFGLPNQPPAPEERAVMAALAILDKLDQIESETGERVQVGIGVNTGPVMAGYLGTDEYVEFTVVGFPVNVAWGLETLARPNRILIGSSTYQAVSRRFEIQSLGAVQLKQAGEPVQAYEVLRAPEKKIAAHSGGA
jgi:adenylate cyclase